MRGNEPALTDPTNGEGSQIPNGPEGPSFKNWMQKNEQKNEEKTKASSGLNKFVNQERDQETKNEISNQTSKDITNQGGDAAQAIGGQSASETANAQQQNSWTKHMSDAIQQSVTAGLSGIGAGFGDVAAGAIANEITKGWNNHGGHGGGHGGGEPSSEPGGGAPSGGGGHGGGEPGGAPSGEPDGGHDGDPSAGTGHDSGAPGHSSGEPGATQGDTSKSGDSTKSDEKKSDGKKPSNSQDGQKCNQCGTIGVCYKYYGHWFCADCSNKYYGGKPLTGDTGKTCNDSGKDSGKKTSNATNSSNGRCKCCGVAFDKSNTRTSPYGVSRCCHQCWYDGKVKYDDNGNLVINGKIDAGSSSSSSSSGSGAGKVNGTASSSKGTGKKTETGAYTCSWCGKKTNSIVSGVGSGVYCSNACYQKFLKSRNQGKSSDARGLSVRTSEAMKKVKEKPAMLPQHGSYYDMKEGKIKSY